MTLHAASRDALAAAEQRLQEVVSAGLDSAGLGQLGDELFAVAGLLTQQPSLRRAVADASTDPGRRERLVRGLLEGKVGAATLDVLTSVVTARWSSPRELVAGVETLARTALLTRAERDERLDAVEDELFRLGRIVSGQPELDRLLSDPVSPAEGKVDLVRRLLADRVEPVTMTLVEQLVSRPHGVDVVDGLDELAAMAARRRERSVAHVRSAVPLSEAQQERLVAILRRIYNRPVALHVELDPSLVGGLVVRVGDEVIDGSVVGRLQALGRELAR
ncbi:ATP synthase F1 subcomplex delta subunit [Streptoalloteichus tenebrarius]|uniref:ATP synthase subunit delta n=1 Tax=Streptoalloteichus tenebrarius (strain ATCC 17920 / DSM 40477 / JCM 4838 / CBS 697.72 / NBRC 16177 / NCIMB 11028 / NRRL B-12390 / A12253. 1 / ISP 5477) TaxID=1933 RepID=A0ABT1HXQ4_STRSD|nr:F0F1 ATP synthase subunit delta [Streptoalloteichus tenebrarius]MCP2260299.1 ATP synthase F1 subcomplex delta subunit [Streptoalloteichus tenebrarius]BFF03049.1 F0F1 ATP synthase subunit delta [Streptoalloteichus tenebrarius]